MTLIRHYSNSVPIVMQLTYKQDIIMKSLLYSSFLRRRYNDYTMSNVTLQQHLNSASR